MDVIEQQVRQWLEHVVIGLNLCPFAGAPFRAGQIRITVSHATDPVMLLDDLKTELEMIRATPPSTLETTILVVPSMLSDFKDYNFFLDEVDFLLRRGGWEGEFQIATFHPQYCFDGTQDDDPGNWTNRSPWPILHILREASIDRALENYADPDEIPERNIRKMNLMTIEERREYFPWSFEKS